MKAILNLTKGVYSPKFGQTFEVVEFFLNTVTLLIDNVRVDFKLNEVLIVDIQKEYQKAFDTFNWNGDFKKMRFIQDFASVNRIFIEKPEYNCPA